MNADTTRMIRRSPLLEGLGFRHGFSTRWGGVSAPPFDTGNYGRNVGDAPESVAENHRRLAERVGYAPDELYEATQVHGANAVDTRGRAPGELRAEVADALFSTSAGCAVAVRTADCVPVLVGDEASGAVLAIHAGWRGVVAGVLPSAVRALLERTRTAPRSLAVAIGPHIRGPSFEVGDDVAAQIAGVAHGASVRVGTSAAGKPLVDLAIALRAQLAALGIEGDQIDDVGGCTLTEPAEFFSFRRDGQRSGRHLAVIVARG